MFQIFRVLAVSVFLIGTSLYFDVTSYIQGFLGTEWNNTETETRTVAETVSHIRDKVAETADTVKEAGKVITSEPLRVFTRAPGSNLTEQGIVVETNLARTLNGLPPLAVNQELSHAAFTKALDMLEKQYFAHESPDGKGPSDVVDAAGYEYLVVGENLAMGLFKDDAALVKAWMESPGHRANILKHDFKEIGIGIVRGKYEGDDVWFAVQEFGRPLTDCPAVDKELAAEIQAQQDYLDVEQTELAVLRKEIENSGSMSTEYRRKAREYNERVELFNDLVEEIKEKIDRYNESVHTFNTCAGVE